MGVYGMDLRRKIVAALERGESVASVAQRFEVDQKTVRSYRRRAAANCLAPQRSGPKRHTKLTDADLQLMREQVAANPGITLRELQGMLSANVAASTVCRALQKMGLSFKKSR